MSTRSFYDAIHRGDVTSLKKILKINNINKNRNKKYTKYTLNSAIGIILATYLEYYNPEIIKVLFDCGLKVDNSVYGNSLTLTLEYGKTYIIRRYDYDRMKAEKNLLGLIQMLINFGAQCNPSIGSKNTFTFVISLENIGIIDLITQANPVPDNTGYLSDFVHKTTNTLTCAVLTKNLELVKIACQHGAKPNTTNTSNTLDYAIQTGDIMIVKEIVMVGGFFGHAIKSRLLSSFFVKACTYNSRIISVNDMFTLLDLIMCSGSEKISTNGIKHIEHISLSAGVENLLTKALDCNAILNKTYSLNGLEQKRINVLKIHLKQVMDELFEKATTKTNKIYEINKAINIPLCCIDIIFEYQRDDGMRYINWLKL